MMPMGTGIVALVGSGKEVAHPQSVKKR